MRISPTRPKTPFIPVDVIEIGDSDDESTGRPRSLSILSEDIEEMFGTAKVVPKADPDNQVAEMHLDFELESIEQPVAEIEIPRKESMDPVGPIPSTHPAPSPSAVTNTERQTLSVRVIEPEASSDLSSAPNSPLTPIPSPIAPAQSDPSLDATETDALAFQEPIFFNNFRLPLTFHIVALSTAKTELEDMIRVSTLVRGRCGVFADWHSGWRGYRGFRTRSADPDRGHDQEDRLFVGAGDTGGGPTSSSLAY